jgi:hypothetical protein
MNFTSSVQKQGFKFQNLNSIDRDLMEADWAVTWQAAISRYRFGME